MPLLRLLLLLLLASTVAGGWTQEAYVWQRPPAAALAGCPASAAAQLDGVAVLAAETGWGGGRADTVYSEIEYRASSLRAFRRLALVVRVAVPPRGFSPDGPELAEVRAVVREVLHRADQGGLTPAELQLDVDCPDASLEAYAVWLRELKSECGIIPLVFTALPSWLGKPGSEALAAAADGFVLQVHSLEKPTRSSSVPPLCDPARVPAWVEAAGRLRRPFRVALPTYAYLLAFRRDGHFIGFSPGGPRPGWPTDARFSELRADEAEMAQLARYLRASHPASCTGLLWFRMPAPGESRGWGWAAFGTVLSGEDPAPALRLECIQKSTTTWEFVLRNDGTASAPVPSSVRAEWGSSVKALGVDATGGYALRPDPEALGAEFVPILRGGLVSRLEPGGRLVIGWARLPGQAEPVLSMEP